MKDRLSPCIYYTCCGGDCKKGFRQVTLQKCKNCLKYRPRKSNHKPETIASKRRKDRDRHDRREDY